MVLGQNTVKWYCDNSHGAGDNLPGDITCDRDVDISYIKTKFGTLIEYDEEGNVVWYWKSSDYFATSDLAYYTLAKDEPSIDVHENSFYFDEKENNFIKIRM